MKVACQYAIVRFLPYMETGEFANIGVLAFAPKTGYLDFKLAPNSFPRVTRFFAELDKKVYTKAMAGFAEELAEIRTIAGALWGKDLAAFGQEVARPRESLIRFSEMRVLMTENPAQTLEELYERYVGRNFVGKERREQAMVNAIKKQLLGNKLQQFYKQFTFEVDYRKIQFPLVWQNERDHCIIKPLALNVQKDPSKLVEHADEWRGKVQWLLDRERIRQDELMIPLDPPASGNDDMQDAYQVARCNLAELGVELVEFNNKSRILDFARQPSLFIH
ncbi:DUF3037 domain-containing protein [Gilvimarinus sp. SDUM040013]|uniref:DUF3037 domain-containing protein n=1 Tax=Gilvimarinus gilvus TaxID=3058038 RepID=A0ABU4RUW7_9GAMM|nr:DUF3037 domain-containing protein [Gilvimarinus sp. SDUM040013]MDO3387962.1 DUF3037 domain-containing protein [Gilvimarinus sp. SDUM040013]MDX6848667.1 DUF3037 domain-containing protein [Gilvimarinus sp. SDUM040013]